MAPFRLTRTSYEPDHVSLHNGGRSLDSRGDTVAHNLDAPHKQQRSIPSVLGPLAAKPRQAERVAFGSLPPELITHIASQDVEAAKVMRLLNSDFKNLASASVSHIAIRNRTDLASALSAYAAGGITSVTLRDSDITDDDLLILPDTLTELDVHGCKNLTTDGIRNLMRLKKLKTLDFSYCKADDGVAASLSHMKSIANLNISDNCITALGALHIAGMNLAKIDISLNKIGDTGVRALAENQGIQYINARFNNVGDGGASAFKGKKKEYVDLSINDIGDHGVAELASGSEFHLLNVRNNLFGEPGMRLLRSNRAITQLIVD